MTEPRISLGRQRRFWKVGRAQLILSVLSCGVAWHGVAPAGLSGQDERAYEVLEAAAERYSALETLCATFHQEIEVTLLGETRSGEGILCQRQPSEFSMRFSDPAGDVVVVDGEYLWTFYPSMDAKQVLRFAAQGAEGRYNFYKNLLENPRARFEAEYSGIEQMDSRAAHRLTVTPRGSESFRSVVVWIDAESELITGVDVHDKNASIRRVRLTDLRPNVELSEDEFVFVPPPGARVMSR